MRFQPLHSPARAAFGGFCLLFGLGQFFGCQGESVTQNNGASPGAGQGDDIPPQRRVVEEELPPGNQAGLPACKPALGLGAKGGKINPGVSVPLLPQGGTGAYTYEVMEEESGGELNRLVGIFKAGQVPGERSTIRMRDEGCRGETTVGFEVVDGMRVVPSFAQIKPGQTIAFEVSYQGQGVTGASFALSVNQTGATVSEQGVYTAGAGMGRDVVSVSREGQEVEVVVAVAPEYAFALGMQRLVLGVGNRVKLERVSGSGEMVIEGKGGDLVMVEEGNWLRALTPGSGEVEVIDRFTKERAPLKLHVSPNFSFDLERARDNLESSDVLWFNQVSEAKDVNGDGHLDVILGAADADLTLSNQGAAFLYLGTPEGLETTPAQTFAGLGEEDQLGGAFAFGDFDGDGTDDLAIGAGRGTVRQKNQGYVAIYKGIKGGLFSQKPTHVLAGMRRDNISGAALAACDFNDDGLVDLAVGVPRMEDLSLRPRVYDHGGFTVYFGTKDTGLPPTPDQEIFGEFPQENGEYVAVRNARMGTGLVSGQFDGEGGCDLAVIGQEFTPDETMRDRSGIVAIHRGIKKTDQTRGGVAKRPAVFYADLEGKSGKIGSRAVAGDLDGDGKDDLVVSALGVDEGETRDVGYVRVILGKALGEGEATRFENFYDTKGQWSHVGERGYQHFGSYLGLEDSDGDGDLDVLVSSRIETVETKVGDEVKREGDLGTVRLYKNDGKAGFDKNGELVARGLKGGDQFGSLFCSVGDKDGDGKPDIFGYASSDDTLGRDVGRPYFAKGVKDLKVLDYPGNPAGGQFGRSSAMGKKGGDLAWMALGSDVVDYADLGSNAGQVVVYDPKAFGLGSGEPKPIQVIRHRKLSGNARFGYKLEPLPDLNGDGIQELGVVGISDNLNLRDLVQGKDDEVYVNHNCGTQSVDMYDSGALFVYLSKGQEFEAEPAYKISGPERHSRLQTILWDSDVDGDGKDDLLLSFPTKSFGDGYSGYLVKAPPLPAPVAGKTTIVCTFEEPKWVAGKGNLGLSIASMGDMDGDGCDELAMGAHETEVQLGDRPERNTGSVHLVYGYGAGCATLRPRSVKVEGSRRDARFGQTVVAGDFTGDGKRDLAIASPYERLDDSRGYAGAVRLVSWGTMVSWVPAEHEILEETGAVVRLAGDVPVLDGKITGEQIGYTLGVAQGVLGGGRDALLVASQRGDEAGVKSAGAVTMYDLEGGVFRTRPVAGFFAGDTEQLNTLVGYSISTASTGSGTWVMLGTPGSSTRYPQGGGALMVELKR